MKTHLLKLSLNLRQQAYNLHFIEKNSSKSIFKYRDQFLKAILFLRVIFYQAVGATVCMQIKYFL